MAGISNVSFLADNKDLQTKNKKTKKEIVYVSKNPERTVNATGVVAGSAGMIGGAVLGGTVGLAKLPGELVKTLSNQQYSQAFSDSFKVLKTELKNSPEIVKFVETIKQSNAAANSEEILEILNTITQKLHKTFENDKEAKAVIDKVVDPVIESISFKKNIRNYLSQLGKNTVKSPIGQTFLKLLGFNKPTSNIIADTIGNASKGITKAVMNIKNFTPEEKTAWQKVIDQIGTELQNNPKIKVSTETIKGIKTLFKDTNWITKPLDKFKESINNFGKNMQSSIGKTPIKTIGLHSLYGAAACSALSLLGWFGMKHALLKKENNNLANANQ